MLKENLPTAFKSILCQMAAAAGFVVAVAILLSGCSEDSVPMQPINNPDTPQDSTVIPVDSLPESNDSTDIGVR